MVKNKVIRQANDGGNTWIDCSLEAFNRAKENGIPVREVCLREESFSTSSANPSGYHIMNKAGEVCADRKTLSEAQQVVNDWNAEWVVVPYYYAGKLS
ncbi:MULTISPECIES: hypothetical protein [Klebsiella/Raoultella group]|uniref:hypothetical protein n=1 Tax=Klebsiella/Raoultella group TaxID=2890311 RepID=UPI0012B819D9|nr:MULTISPECIES: hypothetical protein [Klebsiella]ELK6574836.1 hypothetical protein [Klebsiella michiganensis]MDK9842055.1 hypothetical protein [Klebsiella michiganensis]UVY41836.1 MAG: hypothetical protein [Bacteriophage sp.]